MNVDKAIKIVRELAQTGYWGKVELEYRDGEIVLARKSETIKLEMEKTPNGNPRTK